MIGPEVIPGGGLVPERAVLPERAVVRRTGEDLGSGECSVHYGPQNSPVSPYAPRKILASGIHERAGTGEVSGARQPACKAPGAWPWPEVTFRGPPQCLFSRPR